MQLFAGLLCLVLVAIAALTVDAVLRVRRKPQYGEGRFVGWARQAPASVVPVAEVTGVAKDALPANDSRAKAAA